MNNRAYNALMNDLQENANSTMRQLVRNLNMKPSKILKPKFPKFKMMSPNWNAKEYTSVFIVTAMHKL